MRRLFRVVTLVMSASLAGGLAAGLSAAPAGAVSGPVTSTGCSGVQCWGQVKVQLSGSGYQGGNGNTGYSLSSVPPPACWYGDPMTGAAMYAMEQYDDTNAAGIDAVESLPSATEVNKYKGDTTMAPGAWYEATGDVNNPDTSACVAKLAQQDGGYFLWIVNGAVPAPEVTPLELAEYAYSQMTLPSPDPVANPAKTTFVTLPTFVRSKGHRIGPVQITATVGGVTATVTATPTGLAVSAPGATAYGNGQGGKCLPNGSTASPQTMDKAGAGTTPDCGVVFQSPSSGTVQISATETWTVTSNVGPLPQQPQPTTGTSPPVQVNEIQSVTGPGTTG